MFWSLLTKFLALSVHHLSIYGARVIATISFLGDAVEDNKKSIINIEKATQKLYKKFQTNEINLNYDEEAILLEQATSKIIREIDVQKGIIQNGMKNITAGINQKRAYIHLFCFISNVYKQRLLQRVDIFEIAKQLNPLTKNC